MKKKQKGTATIEFALILPLMVLIWVGTIEVGTAFTRYNNLTKAVRDGARYISLNIMDGSTGKFRQSCIDLNDSDPCAKAKLLILYNTLSEGDSSLSIIPDADSITVSISRAPAASNLNFSITAEYEHELLLGELLNNYAQIFSINTSIPLSFNLRSTMVMRGQ